MYPILTNQLSLGDSGVAGGISTITSLSGVLYSNGVAIGSPYPLSNPNQYTILSIPLVSGTSQQQVIFPQNYSITPNVTYSIVGSGQSVIIDSQITSITNGQINIDFSYPIPNSNYSLQLFIFSNASGIVNGYTSGSSITNWITITGNYNGTLGQKINANSSGGGFTLTLPTPSGSLGQIDIADLNGYWGVNNVTVSGVLFNGSSSPLTLNVSGARATLVDIGNPIGYRVWGI